MACYRKKHIVLVRISGATDFLNGFNPKEPSHTNPPLECADMCAATPIAPPPQSGDKKRTRQRGSEPSSSDAASGIYQYGFRSV